MGCLCFLLSPPSPRLFLFFSLSSQLSRPTRAERFCHAGQWCLLWRLDVKSHSVAVTEGHSLLDPMFSSRIACHRTQYFKLLSLHCGTGVQTQGCSKEYVLSKTFQNLMAGSSCSIFSRKPSGLPKDTNFLSVFSKNLDLFTKKACCWVPKPLCMLSNQKISRKFSVRKENIRGGCS